MNQVELIKIYRQKPIEFIKDIWKLTPQSIKPEHEEEINIFIDNGLWDRIREEYFQPFIKGKNITWQQFLVFKALERSLIGSGKRRISIVSGHKCGKSSGVAMTVLWFLFCHLDAQVGVTATTGDQLHDVLWKELKLWLDRMPKEISDCYEWQTGYVRMKQRPETWFARARTARKESPEAIAGLHGENVLIIGDEASGIEDIIFRSAEGSLASVNSIIILIGNGLKNTGYFYQTHNDDKEKSKWQTLSFNTEESPLATKDYIEEMQDRWGIESDEYKIRVLGKFPSTESMDDIGWIPLITDKDIRQVSDGIPFVGRTYLGIDPAGEGDDLCVFTLRDRFQARVIEKLSESNDKIIAKKTYDIIKRYELQPQDVTVFNFGIGANVSAELLLLDHTCQINAVNEGDRATDEESFLNIRMELVWRIRQWLIRGGALVGDEIKRDVLGYAYKWIKGGRKQLMQKHELKRRMGRSPDRGDSLMATFYTDISSDIHSNYPIIQNQPTQNDIYNPI